MVAISKEVLERNRHFLTPDTDFWVGQRVSRGVDAVGDEGWDQTGPDGHRRMHPAAAEGAGAAVPRRHRHRRPADPPRRARHAEPAGEDA